jgi:hypothetical protein
MVELAHPMSFIDFLHGIFISVGMQVELPEFLNNPEPLALLFGNAKDK